MLNITLQYKLLYTYKRLSVNRKRTCSVNKLIYHNVYNLLGARPR